MNLTASCASVVPETHHVSTSSTATLPLFSLDTIAAMNKARADLIAKTADKACKLTSQLINQPFRTDPLAIFSKHFTLGKQAVKDSLNEMISYFLSRSFITKVATHDEYERIQNEIIQLQLPRRLVEESMPCPPCQYGEVSYFTARIIRCLAYRNLIDHIAELWRQLQRTGFHPNIARYTEKEGLKLMQYLMGTTVALDEKITSYVSDDKQANHLANQHIAKFISRYQLDAQPSLLRGRNLETARGAVFNLTEPFSRGEKSVWKERDAGGEAAYYVNTTDFYHVARVIFSDAFLLADSYEQTKNFLTSQAQIRNLIKFFQYGVPGGDINIKVDVISQYRQQLGKKIVAVATKLPSKFAAACHKTSLVHSIA